MFFLHTRIWCYSFFFSFLLVFFICVFFFFVSTCTPSPQWYRSTTTPLTRDIYSLHIYLLCYFYISPKYVVVAIAVLLFNSQIRLLQFPHVLSMMIVVDIVWSGHFQICLQWCVRALMLVWASLSWCRFFVCLFLKCFFILAQKIEVNLDMSRKQYVRTQQRL